MDEHSNYRLRVSNKAKLPARAERHHIPVGDWFVSPLHPVERDLAPWGYRQGQYPVAEQACQEVINLFTERPLSRRQMGVLFGAGVSHRLAALSITRWRNKAGMWGIRIVAEPAWIVAEAAIEILLAQPDPLLPLFPERLTVHRHLACRVVAVSGPEPRPAA